MKKFTNARTAALEARLTVLAEGIPGGGSVDQLTDLTYSSDVHLITEQILAELKDVAKGSTFGLTLAMLRAAISGILVATQHTSMSREQAVKLIDAVVEIETQNIGDYTTHRGEQTQKLDDLIAKMLGDDASDPFAKMAARGASQKQYVN